jgi:putative phage-type endonuclease
MIENDLQRTEEWFAARVGKVTASRVADAVARTRSGWGASRANYEAELLVERLTGQPAPRFSNAAMQWGTDTEPFAIAAYEFYTDLTVFPVGFVDHPRIAMSGASPDGMVDDGLVEIKCPNTATHIQTLLGSPIDDKYIKQMHWQMACTDRNWCDFVSFDPRMPEEMRIHITRVKRDQALIDSLEKDIAEFIQELAIKEGKLRNQYS